MQLGILDYIFLALIIISSLRGAFRGMIQELISLAALFISLLLSAVFYPDGSQWLRSRSSLENGADFIAFIVIFIVAFILFKLIQKGIVYLINETPFEGMDKLLGFFFGLLEGILICFLLVYIVDFQNLIDLGRLTEKSVIMPYLERFLPALDKPAGAIMNKISSGRV